MRQGGRLGVDAQGSEEAGDHLLRHIGELGLLLGVVRLPGRGVPDLRTAARTDDREVSVEAGVTMGWERYVGSDGLTIGIDSFGASAPAEQLFPHFGFAVDQIVPKILSRLTA